MTLLAFVLLPFAVSRLTHMLTEEDGPADVIATTRFLFSRLGVFDCYYCMSIWTSLLGLIALLHLYGQIVIVWLALSWASIAIHGIISVRADSDTS